MEEEEAIAAAALVVDTELHGAEDTEVASVEEAAEDMLPTDQ